MFAKRGEGRMAESAFVVRHWSFVLMRYENGNEQIYHKPHSQCA